MSLLIILTVLGIKIFKVLTDIFNILVAQAEITAVLHEQNRSLISATEDVHGAICDIQQTLEYKDLD